MSRSTIPKTPAPRGRGVRAAERSRVSKKAPPTPAKAEPDRIWVPLYSHRDGGYVTTHAEVDREEQQRQQQQEARTRRIALRRGDETAIGKQCQALEAQIKAIETSGQLYYHLTPKYQQLVEDLKTMRDAGDWAKNALDDALRAP